MRSARFVAVFSAILLCAGCLRHEAHLPPTPDPVPAFAPRKDGAQVGSTPAQALSAPWSASSPLPISQPTSGWFRSEDGALYRAEIVISTARPWWQRFPCDAAVDFWPTPHVVHTDATLAFAPVSERTTEELTAEARAAGFARPATPKP